MYNNQYLNYKSLWKDGRLLEAQLLRNLLNTEVKLKTICDETSCITYI